MTAARKHHARTYDRRDTHNRGGEGPVDFPLVDPARIVAAQREANEKYAFGSGRWTVVEDCKAAVSA